MNKMRIYILIFFLSTFFSVSVAKAEGDVQIFERNKHLPGNDSQVQSTANSRNKKLINWVKNNVSSSTGLPLSFQIPEEKKESVYSRMGLKNSAKGIIERMIVEEGLVVYDGAVRQIVLSMLGGEENLNEASKAMEIYWDGEIGELSNVRAGFPVNNFIYDLNNPEAVSSDLSKKGKRGFIFRIINANGKYTTSDPCDGKTSLKNFPTWPEIHWEDWKPIAGENAWIVLSALQLYHKKYFDQTLQDYNHPEESIDLELAKEIARAAIFLQAENGGIRMAPVGTFMEGSPDGKGWYDLISTENNLSWYAAFRMLHQITGDEKYKNVLIGMDEYFKVAWNHENKYFYQGMRFKKGQWFLEKRHFATDVQTWGILVLGCEKIDQMFGEESAYSVWKSAKEISGCFDLDENLVGVGFTREHDRVSVEWSAGAIFAARELSDYYKNKNYNIFKEAFDDATQMRQGIESLRQRLSQSSEAYSYSSKRGWIPFGWFSHEPSVLSLASTAWVILLDAEFNPFELPDRLKSKDDWQLAGRIKY